MKTINELEQMKNTELIEYIQELQKINMTLEEKNNRGAGRKEKLTKKQVEEILDARRSGKCIRDIASDFCCSVGLIHKIIKIMKEDSYV